ncbi:hypothetical protein L6164_032948 [Bauhinia variegata]|uniref:Uncharacterized protein n=1 Tax=Bauhinia variegata TaxID=167791 RepID=A0ACB9KQK0_BAUVA|nr:hypothetical protein L6164_032948 [Bauhinia variegata]
MFIQKWLVVLFYACLLLMIASNNSHNPKGAEATQILTLHKRGHSKSLAFSTLGLVCSCCDGEGGECRSTWESACSNLRCHPWKY